MCRLAMRVELGLDPGPYDDERAEGCVRELLMNAESFGALAALPDPYLAACFGVPLNRCRRGAPNSGLRSSERAVTADRAPGTDVLIQPIVVAASVEPSLSTWAAAFADVAWRCPRSAEQVGPFRSSVAAPRPTL
jgi:hypothetical protein